MRFQLLAITLLLLSGLSLANGRKPAVEDFVGIEVEEPRHIPGNESLFNLEKDITKIETARQQGPLEALTPPAKELPATPWSASVLFGIMFILGLPLMTWALIMQHLKKKAMAESASNIELLEKYRKEREEARRLEEENRKVS